MTYQINMTTIVPTSFFSPKEAFFVKDTEVLGARDATIMHEADQASAVTLRANKSDSKLT